MSLEDRLSVNLYIIYTILKNNMDYISKIANTSGESLQTLCKSGSILCGCVYDNTVSL